MAVSDFCCDDLSVWLPPDCDLWFARPPFCRLENQQCLKAEMVSNPTKFRHTKVMLKKHGFDPHKANESLLSLIVS